jgi:hypothetical protein
MQKVSFIYKGVKKDITGSTARGTLGKIIDFLYKNGYSFSGPLHDSPTKKLLNKEEYERVLNTQSYAPRNFHKISGEEKYIISNYNTPLIEKFIKNMLINFGLTEVETSGFEVKSSRIKKFGEIDDIELEETETIDTQEDVTKVYCVRGGRGNSDVNQFLEGNFVGIGYNTRGFDIGSKTKEEIAQFLLMNYENSKTSIPQYIQQIELFKKIKIGDIILVPDNEGTNVGKVISGVYLAEDEHYPNRINVEWLEERVGRNKSLNLPKSVFEVKNFDTEIMNFTDTEDGSIEPFSTRFGIPTDFKAVQAQEEKETKEYKLNPFRQSICVLGDSGAGKSTTLENILEAERHEFEFIIPSASTTGLLSQFSPSKSGYIKSRLGKMIVEAFNSPTTLYTAVFDECHKSNVIEMINDELLQAISTKRNMGKRFISLDEDTSELYKGVETFRGNILIPDNFGFIFISSKPRIIANNTDFFNRVELVLLTEADRNMSTSDELLSKVLPEEEKMKLASTRND